MFSSPSSFLNNDLNINIYKYVNRYILYNEHKGHWTISHPSNIRVQLSAVIITVIMSLEDFYLTLIGFDEALSIPLERHFEQFIPAWNFVNGEDGDAWLKAAKKVVKGFLYYNLEPIHPNISNVKLVRVKIC